MRTIHTLPWALTLVVTIATPVTTAAQTTDGPPSEQGSFLSYAKWGVLGAAVTAGVIGFAQHTDADDRFDAIEAICVSDPTRCAIGADGAYRDADLEARYQQVLDADANARTALVLSQIAVAGALAMFLLDLGGDGEPDNVPYDPDRGLGFRNNPVDGRSELVYVVPWNVF